MESFQRLVRKDMLLREKIKLAIEYKNFLTTTVIGSSEEELKV